MEPKGDFVLTEELLDQVRAKMREYVDKKLPIMKRNVHTDDAVELFARHRMYDKAQLFKYRRVSRVNIYSIGGFEDYFYGYMAQNTGYIRYFDLVPYEHGFVLMLPTLGDPETVPAFVPSRKLFEVLEESSQWGEKLGISNVGSLNLEISRGRANELILIQEALQEKRIGQIAEMIAAQPDKKFVMIAGPSSSGKTTFSHRLSIQLRALGMRPHPIAVDDYFVNRVDSPKDENGNYNYEVLECLDIQKFNQDMTDLLAGKTVELPPLQLPDRHAGIQGRLSDAGAGGHPGDRRHPLPERPPVLHPSQGEQVQDLHQRPDPAEYRRAQPDSHHRRTADPPHGAGRQNPGCLGQRHYTDVAVGAAGEKRKTSSRTRTRRT